MKNEKFDFYSPVNLKSYNLDKTMRYQLDILGGLDFFTRRHSVNIFILTRNLLSIVQFVHIYMI